jgi:hypothetical protein
VIEINTSHPDFVSRIKSRKGRPKFTDRLAGYLSTLIATAYKDRFYLEHGKHPDRNEIYKDLLSDTTRLEAALRRRMPALQRSLNEMIRQGTPPPSTVERTE